MTVVLRSTCGKWSWDNGEECCVQWISMNPRHPQEKGDYLILFIVSSLFLIFHSFLSSLYFIFPQVRIEKDFLGVFYVYCNIDFLE